MVKKTKLLLHVLVWLIFISYEIIYVKFTIGLTTDLFHVAIFYCLNIGLFYVNAHVILDYAFFRTSRPYMISIGLILLEISAYLLLKLSIDYLIADPKTPLILQVKKDQKYALTNIWRGIYFIGFSIAYWSMRYMLKFKERNHQIETEQLKTLAKNLELENKFMSVENAYLQNQISPHLLFNTLNFIYSTVRLQSKDAGEGVSRLSDLMRYSLVSADDTRLVSLAEEVVQLENLVELCRMRFGELFFLRFRKKGKLAGIRIIPLILITLVENMLKHGDLGEPAKPARITLEVKDNSLFFETKNLKRNTALYPKGGLGLKNIEKRLSNYYQGRFSLFTQEAGEFFTVTLTLTHL